MGFPRTTCKDQFFTLLGFIKPKSIISSFIIAFLIINASYSNLFANEYTIDEDTRMFQTTQEVLNNLKKAKGILSTEAPLLKMYKFMGSGKLASLHLQKGEIHLDTETYILCREMGKDSLNALAFLIGHELGHFIHTHGSVNHNIEDEGARGVMRSASVRSLNQEFKVSKKFEKRMSDAIFLYSETHDEAEADFEGAFLGYLAGYDTKKAGKVFLKRAYKKFSLKGAKGYPSLKERLTIIDKTSADLARFTPIFELSKYLVSVGNYADAIPLLQQISRKFESAELYNNIAVAQFLQLMNVFEKPPLSYRLPITFDINFKAPHPQFYQETLPSNYNTGGEQINPNLIQPCHPNIFHDILDESEAYLLKALHLNQDYELALLNLSIVKTLKAVLYKGYSETLPRTNCNDKIYSELQSGLGYAFQAKNIANEKLKGFELQYFANGFPTDTGPAKPLYLREHFGEASLWIPSGRIGGFHHTKWVGTDGIPREAELLSNIWTQIDVIRILLAKGEQEPLFYYHEKRDFSGKVKGQAFDRAIFLNNNNEIALHNKDLYNNKDNLANQTETNTASDQVSDTNIASARNTANTHCLYKSSEDSEDIFDIEDKVTKWSQTESYSIKRIQPYYISDLMIDRANRNKLFHKSVAVTQQLFIKKTASATIFILKTKAKDSDVNFEDKSVFVVDHGRNNTCDVKKGQLFEAVETAYGQPNVNTLTNNGKLSFFRLKNEIKKTNENQTQTTSNDPLSFISSHQEKVMTQEKTTEGVIFDSDRNNKIQNWIYYGHKNISKLPES